jgi:hypothetical protein
LGLKSGGTARTFLSSVSAPVDENWRSEAFIGKFGGLGKGFWANEYQPTTWTGRSVAYAVGLRRINLGQ